MTTIDKFAHYDGAYVLGALSDAERVDFERHLLTCDACTDRVDGLRPLPALLAILPASAYDDAYDGFDDGPPLTLLPNLLRQVRSERRRRQWFTAGLSGLAAACLVVLAVVVWPSGTKGVSGSPPRAMSAVIESPVRATVALTEVKWGTQIRLTCHYGETHPSGTAYQLLVIDKQGHQHASGSWTLQPGPDTHFTGGTAIPRNQIATIEITLPNNQPILELTL